MEMSSSMSSNSSSMSLRSIGLPAEPEVGAGRLKSRPSPGKRWTCGMLGCRDSLEGPMEGAVEKVEIPRHSLFRGRSFISFDPDLCILSEDIVQVNHIRKGIRVQNVLTL